jgi:hypothetical protein
LPPVLVEQQELQNDISLERVVVRQIDHPHASLTQEAL